MGCLSFSLALIQHLKLVCEDFRRLAWDPGRVGVPVHSDASGHLDHVAPADIVKVDSLFLPGCHVVPGGLNHGGAAPVLEAVVCRHADAGDASVGDTRDVARSDESSQLDSV